jgi:histidine ammonia-lyase
MVVTLDGHSLTLESAASVSCEGEKVEVSVASVRQMQKFRNLLEAELGRGEVVYGANTGVGSLSVKLVSPAAARQAQLNVVRSHSAGVGVPMPAEVVRGAMLIRLNSLLNGNSAVRVAVASLITQMLNEGVTPYVPSLGSLGASGDLVPSAHMALALIGEGKAFYRGELLPSKEALKRSGLRPITLEAKEGLSLINGTAFTTALSVETIRKGRVLLNAANACAAISAEALRACAQAFDERLSSLKKSRSQSVVAHHLREMLNGSKRVRTEPIPQDPYSLRCVPQVHGSLLDAIGLAERITVDEMNSVSDNPVLFEDGSVLHGGNFHAQPVAMALDLMSFAISYLGVMSLGRIHYMLIRSPSEKKYMSTKPGVESGVMVLEYTASALAAENAKHAYPLSSYPANVSEGVEDHASFGVNAGLKALAVAENVSKMLAIEMICASNFVGARDEGMSRFTSTTCRRLRGVSPLLDGDRSLGDDIEDVARELLAGRLTK